MNKLSTNCFFKGPFSIGKISILSFSSIKVFSGPNVYNFIFPLLKGDEPSSMFSSWFSIYKLSTNCFFNGSLGIGIISKL